MNRRLAWTIGGLLLACALGVMPSAHATNYSIAPVGGVDVTGAGHNLRVDTDGVLQVRNSPKAPQAARVDGGSFTCAMPAGAPGCCVVVEPDASARVACDAATPCYYRVVVEYSDGGFASSDGGGFAVAGLDPMLPAGSVESIHLTGALNAVCATTADGGTFQAPERYP